MSLGLDSTFKEALKDIGIHVIDVETTGLDTKNDKMYSAASQSYTYDSKGNLSSPVQKEGFFNILGNTKKRGSKKFKSDNQYLTYLENKLKEAHPDEDFGTQQYKAGSLRSTAEALLAQQKKGKLNHATTPEQFLREFKDDLNANTGHLFLTHNSNFESSVFGQERMLYEKGNGAETTFKDLEERNIRKIGKPFKVSDEVAGKNSSLVNQASKIYYDDVLHYARLGDSTNLRASLGKYASKHVDVLNQITSEIKEAKALNKIVAVDSMHLSRALMAFGALSGDVDVHNLMSGDKVEHQVAHFLPGQKELHTAASDSRQQGELFKILTDEIDKYKTIPNYRSTLLQGYNKYLNDNKVPLSNYKTNMLREVKDLHNPNIKQDPSKLEKLHSRFLKSAEILPQGQKEEAVDFLNSFMDDHSTHNTVEGSKKFTEGYSYTKPQSLNEKSKVVGKSVDSFYEGIKKNKKVIGIVGGLAVANMTFGGKKKEVEEPNTYNELYDNVYFGTPLADWQERNNAHKVLY